MAVLTNFGIPDTSGGNDNTLMPKLKYRFRVEFIGMAGDNRGVLTQNVVNVTRPQLTQEEIIIDQYNSKIKVCGKHTWNDITLTIRDDVSSKVLKQLKAQMDLQVNHTEQSAPLAGESYKFQMMIQTLDGSNNASGVLDTWSLQGVWISDINWGDLDYGASESVTVQLTIKYDNALLSHSSAQDTEHSG